MVQFTRGGLQVALQIGQRARLGEQLSPGVKDVGIEAPFLPNHCSRLAAVEPFLDRLALEGFIEFPTAFYR